MVSEPEQDRLFESQFSDVNISQIAQNLLKEAEETDSESMPRIGFFGASRNKSSVRLLSKKSTQKSLQMVNNFNQLISCNIGQDSLDSELLFDRTTQNPTPKNQSRELSKKSGLQPIFTKTLELLQDEEDPKGRGVYNPDIAEA